MSSRLDHLHLLPPCPGQPKLPRRQTDIEAWVERAHTTLGIACNVCGKAAEAYNMTASGACAECTANPVKARAKADKLDRWRKACAKVRAMRRQK